MNRSLFLLLPISSCTHAAKLCDELRFSTHMALDAFSVQAPDFFGQRYRGLNPSLQVTCLKHLTPSVNVSLDIEGEYDINLLSSYAIKSGPAAAHTFTADAKLIASWLHKETNLSLGLGVGIGSFWLKAFILDTNTYDPYPYAYVPLVQVKKAFEFGKPSELCLQYSRLDCYYFQGSHAALNYRINLVQTATCDHDIALGYEHWQMDLYGPWHYKRNVLRAGYSINFK